MSLESEIREQPAVLARLLERQTQPLRRIAGTLRERQIRTVFVAARGSSDNAAIYAKYLWGAHNGLPVALAAPSLFTSYRRPPRLEQALVVAVSQSGQSPDIVGVLEEARRQGAPTLAIVNDESSPLAAAADWVVDICAGQEQAVAASKTYTAQLLAMAMLSVALSGDDEAAGDLARVPAAVEQALALDGRLRERAERYRFMAHCVVLGRGFNYATAFEWALKLKELAYVIAEPYSSADFQHGPEAVLERGFPVLAVAPRGPVFGDTFALLSRLVRERLVELLLVSDDDAALALAHTPVPLPGGLPEWLSPISAMVVAQLFCYHLTRAKGFDTESPRGLKKVTLTR
jgi:glucosamine--fructose-6-phosphate aminotransferase (isomerizing)